MVQSGATPPVVLGQDGWSVTYTTQSICTLEGSTVELSCSYTYPSGTVTTTFWFTKNDAVGPVSLSDDPDYKGRVTYRKDKENGHTLSITDLRESDSATYKFRFTDQTGKWRYTGKPGVTLSVTGLQVKVTGGHQDKTLTCITTCTLTDNPTYIWYKNGQHLDESTSPQYKDPVSSNYVDSYSCAVKGHEDLHSPAVCQNCWSVTYTHQSICVLKGSTVDISCSYTYPSYHEIKKAFWFTKWSGMEAEDLNSVPGYEGHIEYIGDKKSDCTLRITDLRLRDSAGYRFRFITSGEKGRYYGDPGVTLSRICTLKGSSVNISCSYTYPRGHTVSETKWYTKGKLDEAPQILSPGYGGRVEYLGNMQSDSTLRITDLREEDSAEYKFRFRTDQTNWEPTFPGTTLTVIVSSEDAGRYSCAVEGHEDLPSNEETLTVRCEYV
ncbi:uncharacterized protein LOC115177904 [Salmo trutta]|uniref:uncharacterized protein LOC115177904 n=1 Tax=Salmo trutta TaxID=8032 RepID=UPI001131C353|nr:uncharacterized protein LOC115177904 [Salmo trutta]